MPHGLVPVKEPITVGELKEMLEIWPDDYELRWGTNWGAPFCMPYEFFQLKQRGKNTVQIELQSMYEDEEWAQYMKKLDLKPPY